MTGSLNYNNIGREAVGTFHIWQESHHKRTLLTLCPTTCFHPLLQLLLSSQAALWHAEGGSVTESSPLCPSPSDFNVTHVVPAHSPATEHFSAASGLAKNKSLAYTSKAQGEWKNEEGVRDWVGFVKQIHTDLRMYIRLFLLLSLFQMAAIF